MSISFIVLLVVLLAVLCVSGWLAYKCTKQQQQLDIASCHVQKLESQLLDNSSKGSKMLKLQERYDNLESRVKELGQALSIVGSANNPLEQINQLEQFFIGHFKNVPPHFPRFFSSLRRMADSDRIILKLHSNVMRPLHGVLCSQEVTDDPAVQRVVLAEMLDALWLTFDAIESVADVDNMRSEQQFAVDYIIGNLSREQLQDKAIVITTDPDKTPQWLRVIRRAVLPLHLDSINHQVLYSGYKLDLASTSKTLVECTKKPE